MIHASKAYRPIAPSYQDTAKDWEIKHLREILKKQEFDISALGLDNAALGRNSKMKDALIEAQDKQIKVLRLRLHSQKGGVN